MLNKKEFKLIMSAQAITTTAQLIQRVIERTGFHPYTTALIVNEILYTIAHSLENGVEVKLTNFGRFKFTMRPSHLFQHPGTKEYAYTKPTFHINFSPSLKLKTLAIERRHHFANYRGCDEFANEGDAIAS